MYDNVWPAQGAPMNNNPYAISRKLVPQAATVTDVHVHREAAPSSNAASVKKLHCKLGTPGGSARLQSSELAILLRYRLKLAIVIAIVPFVIFLVRSFVKAEGLDGPTTVGLALHCVIVAVMIGLASVLWTTIPLGLRALRAMELTLFGLIAVFFTYLHFNAFSYGQVLEWANPEHREEVAVMASVLSNLRWFTVIVLYGTFVPNTWRRCALIVGILVSIPF